MNLIVMCIFAIYGQAAIHGLESSLAIDATGSTEKHEAQIPLPPDCEYLEIVDASAHLSLEGVYKQNAALPSCAGRPVWQMLGTVTESQGYIYAIQSGTIVRWVINDVSNCSNFIGIESNMDASTPGAVTSWEEVLAGSWNDTSLKSRCLSGPPCSNIRATYSLTSGLEGQYQQYRICNGRPAYKKSYGKYLYFFHSATQGSAWLISDDKDCTRDTIGYYAILNENTGYPYEATNKTWQLADRSSDTLKLKCDVQACEYLEVVDAKHLHYHVEGVYAKDFWSKCSGRPVWNQIGPGISGLFYIYTAKVGNQYRWVIGQDYKSCSTNASVVSSLDSTTPNQVSQWKEYNSTVHTSTGITVNCIRNKPCPGVLLSGGINTNGVRKLDGLYVLNGTCRSRPVYRQNDIYLLFFYSANADLWVITKDSCMDSQITVLGSNADNSGYPYDAKSGQWQEGSVTLGNFQVKCTHDVSMPTDPAPTKRVISGCVRSMAGASNILLSVLFSMLWLKYQYQE